MDKELARKRPAEVTTWDVTYAPFEKSKPILPRHEIMTASVHGRAELIRQVRALARRGEIGQEYALQKTPTGWAVKVVRIREARPRWPRYVVLSGLALGFLAGLAWLVVSVVTALVAAVTAVAPTLLGLAGAIVVTAIAVAVFRPSTIEVIQKVTIRR